MTQIDVQKTGSEKEIVPGWSTVAEKPAVLVKEYSFGPGAANAFAVQLGDGTWMIVSPPRRLSEAEVQAFQRAGGVSALVSNNGSHHLGLGPCKAVLPDAKTYAAPRSAARIRKKGKDYGELLDPEQLKARLGDKVTLVSVDGDKIGDVLVRVATNRGTVLYASDFIANISKLPPSLPFRLFFKLTDSGPGLKVFNAFFLFFVSDKKAARASLIRELRAHPPAVVVPAHGALAQGPKVADTLARMLGG